MKIIPKTKEDFAWANWGPKDIEKQAEQLLNSVKADYEKIKAIPKNERTFKNTVYALEVAGETGSDDSPIFTLKYVSPKESVRDTAKKVSENISKELIELNYDEDLYRAFLEYNPKKEKLSDEEKMLYKDTKLSFEKMGFHLPKDKQELLKKSKKRLSKLGSDFVTNIDTYEDYILCTKEELAGMPEGYIANLAKDKKTGKYKVSLAYPELYPFLTYADSEKKRKELADKSAQEGGKKNIKILSEILKERKKVADMLGYDSYVDYVLENRLAKNNKIVRSFLEGTLVKMKPFAMKEKKTLKKFTKKEFGRELIYYNSAYMSQKMKERLYSFDEKSVKEYFEINHTLNYMLEFFGDLFRVSFRENTTFPVWHKEVFFYDVIEKGKAVAHIGFDLYPRKSKYSHMAFFYLSPGKTKVFRGKEYAAPVGLIVGNFPKGTKKNPSLLSFSEIKTLFHEFGHACHGLFSRASFASQSGTSCIFDFVETPSQMFENWVKDKDVLRDMSSHYKTGEKIPNELLDGLFNSLDYRKIPSAYSQFSLAYQDNLMHAEKYNVDPLKLDSQLNKKFGFTKSPKSLFPAGFGHLYDYGASYYTYMWSLVYAYDIFSRFKKEGIRNKKVGRELRDKILSKGGSVDEMKQMKDFLGRKPNNKAFLKALGIK